MPVSMALVRPCIGVKNRSTGCATDMRVNASRISLVVGPHRTDPEMEVVQLQLGIAAAMVDAHVASKAFIVTCNRGRRPAHPSRGLSP